MIHAQESFLRLVANPLILMDHGGNVHFMNDSAASMLASAGHAFAHKIDKIDYSFDPGSLGQSAGAAGKIQVGEKCWRASVFPFLLNDGQEGFLFLPEAEDILKLVDFDTFLNSIDAAIVITDQNGMLEHINDSLSRLLGVGVREWVGRNVQECIDQKVLTDSVSLKVLRAKKPISMNVSYGAGVTIHYKSVPIMDGHGEVRKVISTGRDVTRLINLEKDLSSSETLKDQYYQRLNTLEVLLGGERIVYSSEPMRKVVQVAIKAGKFDTPVFLWGESGVGKEMAARLIHQSGIRSPGPFVGVNCSAVPSELLESEFFGYADGAFTGARKGGQKGLFDEAEGGTLFLDEITELSLTMQSKLLRVIQEHEFMRVGGRKSIRTDARIIASTNLSWEELTEGSGFRRDLFYRLSVIPIQIPPLRDRRDDILPLIRFFLKTLNQKYKTNIKLAHSLLPRLYNYAWPGNVRELKNVIERLIVVAGADEVGEEELELLNQLDVVKPSDLKEDVSVNRLMPLQEAREKLEQILFKRAYQEGGSIEKAAELLQINPSTIYRKIKKGRLQPP